MISNCEYIFNGINFQNGKNGFLKARSSLFVFGIKKKRVECNYTTSRKKMQLIKSENLTFTLLILMTLNFLVKTHKFQGLLATRTKIKFRIVYSNFWFSYYFLRHTLSICTNYCKVQRCKYICIYMYIVNKSLGSFPG